MNSLSVANPSLARRRRLITQPRVTPWETDTTPIPTLKGSNKNRSQQINPKGIARHNPFRIAARTRETRLETYASDGVALVQLGIAALARHETG